MTSTDDRPNVYASMILFAMNKLHMPMYEGTVTAKTRARRRAKGKVAKHSRKVNRGL